MKRFVTTLNGGPTETFFPETPGDVEGFRGFLSANAGKAIGVDTETTGLDPYSGDFACRLVQFGTDREAWVLRADLFRGDIVEALTSWPHFVAHNAPFDLQVIDRAFGVPVEDLGPRVFDTSILAHLLDPRQRSEGGAGRRMKELAEVYIDPDARDGERELHEVFRREYGATKETGWAVIDIDHPTYLRYAGLDPILAVRLFRELAPLVRDTGLSRLSEFEHHLAVLLATMQRRGVRVDVPYAMDLRKGLTAEAAAYRAKAAGLGVENVNSTAQVAATLVDMGESLTARTPSGAYKVSKEVLLPLADLDRDWQRIESREPNPLADATLRAKRAEKWEKSYVGAFLERRDAADRIHPSIGALQARTARMSISRPALQQLPSSDWTIRRCLIADPGYTIVAADYSQVEMRVLAALADEPTMKAAIASGDDLHDFTARLVYGEGFTPRQRKLMKGVGFGKVYGGGAATLSQQTGADLESVRGAIAEYDRVYPGLKAYSRRLQRRAQFGKREVVTVSGRHLPLDKDRLYAATNYVVQSTARDLLAQAIVDLHSAGLGEYLLLPVHDEVVAQAPTDSAEEVVRAIGQTMESTFYGVHIASDASVYGPSWGHGYGAPL